jgi:hypothetical protein
MAGYTRTDTTNNIATGNVINASDLDNEYDAIQAAYNATTGHTHGGAAGEGAPITRVGPVQDVVVSGSAVTPKTDNTMDLGSAALEFKDLFIDGTANIDSLVADTADINGGTIDGVTIGTNSVVTDLRVDNLRLDGNTISSTDTNGNIVLAPNGTGDVLPGTDDTYDLGSTSAEWKDLWIDGTANIDSLVADTADINGGTVDGAVIGGASAAAGNFTTLGATGVATFSAGTVSAPAITTTGDTNTGIFFPAADTIAFTEGGAEAMRIDSSGNVGIGTTDIYSRFNIQGSVIVAPTTGEANGVGALRIIGSPSALSDVNSGIEFKIAGDTNGYGSKISVISSGGSNIVFANRNATATWTEQMRITPTGNVGIGTSSPSKKLEVYATVNSLQILSIVRNDQAGTGVAAIGFNTASTGGGEATSTKAGIGLLRGASFGRGALCFYNNDTASAGDFTTADERMRITSGGNVGIGTNNPSAVLHLARSGAEEVSTKYTNGGGAASGFVVGANNSGIGLVYHVDNQPILFATNNAERMRITAAGRVAINSSTAEATLMVAGTGAAVGGANATNLSAIMINAGVTAVNDNAGLEFKTSVFGAGYGHLINGVNVSGDGTALVFSNRQNSATWTEAMRISSAGNIGLGTVSPNVKLQVVGKTSLGNQNITSADAGIDFIDTATTGGNSIRWLDSSGYVGNITQYSTGHATLANVMAINNSGGCRWSTGGAERMRITPAGDVLVGTTSTITVGSGSQTGIYQTGAGTLVSSFTDDAWYIRRQGADGAAINFYKGTTAVGSISVTASATAFNTSSDYRLKENIAPMTGALDVVQQLKPVTYNWKVDGSASQGFIAHELAEVVPDCVTGEKDAVDEDGNPVYQGIDTSFLVATLTASIQELKAIVDAQAARIAALESN